jgi:hypothetical protein
MTLRRETILMTIAALLTVGLRQPLGVSNRVSWPTGDFDNNLPAQEKQVWTKLSAESRTLKAD